MAKKKFSTSTVLNEEIVPWLAATGPLSYCPQNPPDRDYYFQYSWVVPGVFAPGHNNREHYWFGEKFRADTEVELLFSFWNKAREGEYDELFLSNGRVADNDILAPIGVYRYQSQFSFEKDRLIFIQHGSYLIADVDILGEIEKGHVTLYRGIQKEEVFRVYRLKSAETRSAILNIHSSTLTDSVTSFNTVHCNVCRSETEALNDRSRILGKLARKFGIDPDDESIDSVLHSGYALEDWCGKNKFGPNYVKFRTPLTNVRITTFVCNETEVKVIDPNKLEVIEAVGCRVQEVEV